jgi:hypothetical protein
VELPDTLFRQLPALLKQAHPLHPLSGLYFAVSESAA